MSLRTRKLFKRLASASALLFFLLLTVWMIYLGMRPDRLSVGHPIPPLHYLTPEGDAQLRADGLLATMVLYFHSQCKYCQYELSVMNENLPSFAHTRLVLLSPETDFFAKGLMSKWPELSNATNTCWGIVDGKQFAESFGNRVFPSIFLFDQQGRLSSKLFGEVKLSKILFELKKSGGSERRVSGIN